MESKDPLNYNSEGSTINNAFSTNRRECSSKKTVRFNFDNLSRIQEKETLPYKKYPKIKKRKKRRRDNSETDKDFGTEMDDNLSVQTKSLKIARVEEDMDVYAKDDDMDILLKARRNTEEHYNAGNATDTTRKCAATASNPYLYLPEVLNPTAPTMNITEPEIPLPLISSPDLDDAMNKETAKGHPDPGPGVLETPNMHERLQPEIFSSNAANQIENATGVVGEIPEIQTEHSMGMNFSNVCKITDGEVGCTNPEEPETLS